MREKEEGREGRGKTAGKRIVRHNKSGDRFRVLLDVKYQIFYIRQNKKELGERWWSVEAWKKRKDCWRKDCETQLIEIETNRNVISGVEPNPMEKRNFEKERIYEEPGRRGKTAGKRIVRHNNSGDRLEM